MLAGRGHRHHRGRRAGPADERAADVEFGRPVVGVRHHRAVDPLVRGVGDRHARTLAAALPTAPWARDGIGDPYYPTAGNGGYQIDGYDLNLQYVPETNALTSTATLTGSVTSEQGLSQFNLDLQPNLTVSAVTVNDAAADVRAAGRGAGHHPRVRARLRSRR